MIFWLIEKKKRNKNANGSTNLAITNKIIIMKSTMTPNKLIDISRRHSNNILAINNNQFSTINISTIFKQHVTA